MPEITKQVPKITIPERTYPFFYCGTKASQLMMDRSLGLYVSAGAPYYLIRVFFGLHSPVAT